MKKVETLPLDAVQEGMVVHQAVLDDGGRVLLPAGAVLSASVLASLARRSVAEVCIEHEVEEDPALREAYRAKVVMQLDFLFRLAGDAPAIKIIYQAVLNYRMENRA